jgi:3-hydroxyisobutyrate dehydrogenase-like beta-hydroxyacid dehydrogenase
MANSISTVGLLSPGAMGHAIGGVLRQNGLRVITCLDGRSERSRALADKAGIEAVPSMEDLVDQAQILLCVLVPARAVEVAEQVARAVRATNADLLYVDCNAIAPRTAREVGRIMSDAGARVADVGIIGQPPTKPGTKFYVSGPGAAEFGELANHGLDVRPLGPEMGQASGFKMCYGALTKGIQALATESLIAAEQLGLSDALRAEQQDSVAPIFGWLEKQLPSMPPRAYRWVGEMEEIAMTFDDLGMTPRMLLGAADVYRFVTDTALGHETPETRDPNRTMPQVISGLAEELELQDTAVSSGDKAL